MPTLHAFVRAGLAERLTAKVKNFGSKPAPTVRAGLVNSIDRLSWKFSLETRLY
ncbi:MAG: hypothetical protein ACRC32_30520 [Chroococcidiopsis sp.]